MAIGIIDISAFLNQWKAVISRGFPYRDALAITAEHGYGSWWKTAKTHTDFQREIKEDI